MAMGSLPPQIENFLTWQASFYSEHKKAEEELRPGPFITVSRQFGCEGIPLAHALVERLNRVDPKPTPWVVTGKEVIEAVSGGQGVAAEFVEALTESWRGFIRQTVETVIGKKPTEYQAFEALAKTLLSIAEAGRAIIVGRGGAIVCGSAERGIHLRLVAPLAFRAAKIARERSISGPEAESIVTRGEGEREAFVRDFTGKDLREPTHYNIVFNNEWHTVEEVAELVLAAMRAKKFL